MPHLEGCREGEVCLTLEEVSLLFYSSLQLVG